MKNLILIIVMFLLQFCYSQRSLTGIYNTDFGVIKIVEETNRANPNKTETVIYGDYRNLGTIISTSIIPGIANNYTIKGTFMNGNDLGSFEWNFTPFQNEYNSFKGKWGWGSKLDGGKWDGKRKKDVFLPTDLKFAVWSGSWDTDFGKIFLKQNGNQVTGDYRDLGAINATVNGNKLKGTFYNKGTKGSFEFTLNGNKFTGVWGWGTKLDQGKWNGTKTLKTNSIAEDSTPTNNTSEKTARYRLTLDKIYAQFVDDGIGDETYELFGIGWCRAYDSEGKQIKPFDVTYSDRYGRFWEILPKDYINLGQLHYNNTYNINKKITFDFPINNSNNIEEILKKSKIELTVELKDLDNLSSHDILGKERVVIPLNEANIERIPGANMKEHLINDQPKGVFTVRHGRSGIIYVFYYIEKL